MRTFDWRFWVYVGVFTILIAGICFLPYLFTSRSWCGLDFTSTGQIGDTLGGIMGPFIAIAASVLTFIAFWVQYKANEQQRQDIGSERFETKYYELIRLHKENVNEIKLSEARQGRNAFVTFYEELRLCFWLVKDAVSLCPQNGDDQKNLGFKRDDDEQILRIAFLLFFIGSGTGSPGLLPEKTKDLASASFLDHLDRYIKDIKHLKKFEFTLNDIKCEFEYDYPTLNGHLSELGHYYRHLYQAVKYIDSAPHIGAKQKYDYVKTIRAQLSSFEQILLYYNTFSRFGKAWLNEQTPYLIRYRMIKNLPLPLAHFGIKPEDKFEKEVEITGKEPDKFFEWHEV